MFWGLNEIISEYANILPQNFIEFLLIIIADLAEVDSSLLFL